MEVIHSSEGRIPKFELIVQLVSRFLNNEELLRFKLISHASRIAIDDISYIGNTRFKAVMDSVLDVIKIDKCDQFYIPTMVFNFGWDEINANFHHLFKIHYLKTITSLSLKTFTGCPTSNDVLFMEGLPNLEELIIDTLEILDGAKPGLPQTLTKLRKLEIYCAFGSLTTIYCRHLITSCPELSEILLPLKYGYQDPIAEINEYLQDIHFLRCLIVRRSVGIPLKILGIRHLKLDWNPNQVNSFFDFVKLCSQNEIKLVDLPSSSLEGYENLDRAMFPASIINETVNSFDFHGFSTQCFNFNWDNLASLSIGQEGLTNMSWPENYIPVLPNLIHITISLVEASNLNGEQNNWDRFYNILFPVSLESKRVKLTSLELYGNSQFYIENDFYIRLVHNAPHLKSLNMTEWTLTNFDTILIGLTQLTELRIFGAENIDDSHFIGPDADNPLILMPKNLTLLEIDVKETKLSRHFFEEILSQMTLSTLRLHSYTNIEHGTIRRMRQQRLGQCLRHSDFPPLQK